MEQVSNVIHSLPSRSAVSWRLCCSRSRHVDICPHAPEDVSSTSCDCSVLCYKRDTRTRCLRECPCESSDWSTSWTWSLIFLYRDYHYVWNKRTMRVDIKIYFLVINMLKGFFVRKYSVGWETWSWQCFVVNFT